MDNKGFEDDGVDTMPTAVGGAARNNGDVSVVVNRKKNKGGALRPYPGMGKEDLLKFSQSTFWIRLRLCAMILFWILWIGLFVTVIVITISEDRCDEFPNPPWWQSAGMYQVHTRSFQDSNNDGYGDLTGIQSRLQYISSIAANALVLSSFYQSQSGSDGDFGYDITSYTDVHPEAGTMEDFDAMLQEAQQRGISVLLDFVPNHTGNQHQWFQNSEASADPQNEYWNYYIWANGDSADPENIPPNNWRSVYGGSAWTYSPTRGQWYYHNYLSTQPELNLRSSAVQEQLDAALEFWLEKGVDGFVVNSASLLYESTDLQDEPVQPGCGSDAYSCLEHVHTRHQPENVDIVARWRRVLDQWSTETRTRLLVVDVASRDGVHDTLASLADYYGYSGTDGGHIVLNYGLTTIDGAACGGQCVYDLVREWIYATPSGVVYNWLSGTHNTGRLAGEDSTASQILYHMLISTLPGSAAFYYGDEISIKHGAVDPDNIRDPAGRENPDYNRDPYRSPMQWNDDHNAGFMSNTSNTDPWLPINDDYLTRNVRNQTSDSSSEWSKFAQLMNMKQLTEAIRFGNFHYAVTNENIFSFVREWEGFDRYLIALNFGSEESTDDYADSNDIIAGSATVQLVSHDSVRYSVGDEVDTNRLILAPGEGIIVSWPYER